jgi:DNA modification methylase
MPRLTEQEQQEILRYLEADKPLPDKYRFLLFEEKREVELVWNGKTSEVCNIVLPFQVIEQVDEPRTEKPVGSSVDFGLFDARGRQLKGWTNKLIWGDNKLIVSSLKNGPLREEIEKQGGLKLIYIDPPFDVGADFSMDIEIGDETFSKKPNILEEIAYRDTWGKGADSFIAMIFERLILMRELLAEDGCIYVHCDWRLSADLRLVLDEVMSPKNFLNQVVWVYGESARGAKAVANQFARNHDDIFYYRKSASHSFSGDVMLRRYSVEEARKQGFRQDEAGVWFKTAPRGDYTDKSIARLELEGRIHHTRTGGVRIKYPLESDGEFVVERVPVGDSWADIPDAMHLPESELTGYATQKSEALVARILRASSKEGDLVADFFCGSGTVAAAAEKLGRKWIVCDLGKFAIHTTRKRMIGVQRQLKDEGNDYRAFEILNLGKYERQHYVGINPNLRAVEQQKQLEEKEAAFVDLILRAYRAEKTEGFIAFHGKKAGRLVAVGPVNLPVTRLFIEEVILECRKKHITKVDILGFEFEMGLFPNVLDEARAKGIDIAPKYIPAEVFDKRAVEKNQVVFHDVAAIEVKPRVRSGKKGSSPAVAVELTDFSVFYSQDSIANAEAEIKNKGSRIVVEKGQIVKVSKDKDGVVTREVLTREWTDWVDYWAVDFNFESKREIIRVKNEDSGEWEERWTGDYIFENEWQSFRTKKDRSLELTSAYHECAAGRRKIAVKVVDIFGNDTMTIMDVSVGGS